MTAAGNILNTSFASRRTRNSELVAAEGVRIERIVSTGKQVRPGSGTTRPGRSGCWCSGSAGLLFEGEPIPRELKRGDYLLIPAGKRHRLNGQTRRSRRSGLLFTMACCPAVSRSKPKAARHTH